MPSSAIGGVRERVLRRVLESILGSVPESDSEMYLGAYWEVYLGVS